MASAPKVFISYSHDNEEHRDWVERLATDLRNKGVDAIFDKWEIEPGDDITAFMERAVTETDYVVVVCTPRYVSKANAGEGGVGYEKMIITAELVNNLGTRKFIPITRKSLNEKRVPIFMGTRLYVDFDDDSTYESSLHQLAETLHNQLKFKKPPLGKNPFLHSEYFESGTSRDEVKSAAPRPEIDEDWLNRERASALADFANAGFNGSLEISFALAPPKPRFPPAHLLQAARRSTISTFGWPIGVVLDNRDEYRPRPRLDGIYARIATERDSYDYWTISASGDFFLLKSLFEDQRRSSAFFFDTRIVRTAEALLYCANLYSNLGVPEDSHVKFQTIYRGIKGRMLSVANQRRMLFGGRTCNVNDVATATEFTLAQIKDNPMPMVKSLLNPVFTMFDFFELSDEVYADIVSNFVNGKVA